MATVNIGNLTFTHRGDYAGGTAYAKNDVVYYATNGNAYIAKQATTGNVPTNGTYWSQFAAGSGGIWNAGLSLGSAGQAVKVNAAGNALEFGSAGGVTQFVTARDATVKTRAGAGTLDLVSLNITPSSTSSKILLLMQCAWGYTSGSSSPNASCFPRRAISGGSTTDLSQEAASGASPGGVAASEFKSSFGTEMIQTLSGHYVDVPNTTSAITYTLVYRVEDVANSETMYIGSPGSTNTATWHTRVPHTFTAIEIGV